MSNSNMSAQHTPGAWTVGGLDGRIIGPLCDERQFGGGEITRQKAVCTVIDRVGETSANARRIVACVNALEGLSTEDIEAGKLQKSALRAVRMKRHRDDLLAACEGLLAANAAFETIGECDPDERWATAIAAAQAAIATAKSY